MVRGAGDRVADIFILAVLLVIGLAAIFPFLYVVAVSLTPYTEVIRNGGYIVIPRSITFQGYAYLLTDSDLPRAMGNTVFITVFGTLISLVGITSLAYPLSRRGLPGRSYLLLFIVFTMLFGGGLIPTYLLVKSLGLLNTMWAMVVPGAIATFHVLIMKTFFEQLPVEIFESARMDGAKEIRIMAQIVLPLSLPVVLTIGLFNMVSYWNTFFSAILYVTDASLHPLQVLVRRLLMDSSQSTEVINVDDFTPTVTMQMAAVVIASLPMIIVYPFIQKHFTKGMLLGSIKG
jgi:putative aldouronate transport system permease protein